MKRVFSLCVLNFYGCIFLGNGSSPRSQQSRNRCLHQRLLKPSKRKTFPTQSSIINKAIELDAKMATAYIGRGIVANNQNKYPEAIADFTKAITLDPKLADAYANRGISSLKLNKSPEALADFNKAIEIDPKMSSPLVNRGIHILRAE